MFIPSVLIRVNFHLNINDEPIIEDAHHFGRTGRTVATEGHTGGTVNSQQCSRKCANLPVN